MTSKGKVLSVYPDARVEIYRLGQWRVGAANRYMILMPGRNACDGDTESEAWDHAASKLPKLREQKESYRLMFPDCSRDDCDVS